MVVNIFYESVSNFWLKTLKNFKFLKIFIMFQVYGFLRGSESILGLKHGYWTVSLDNEMVFKIILS